jgi:hypothetical protein
MGTPAVIPNDGSAVSLPQRPKYTYPAYGETLKVTPAPKGGNMYLIRANTPRPPGR